jgi:3-oxoacyl-[acyl-carrier-protein] synthase III
MSQTVYSRMESIGVYLPEKSVSTKEIVKGCAHRLLVPVERLTGIKSRRVAGDKEWGYDLAVKAVQDCLAHSSYGPEDIDVLINCNISHFDGEDRWTYEPCRSIHMRADFGMDRALAFDLTNACAGMFTGIYLVEALIQAGIVRCGLVVSGEYITKCTETAQKEIKGLADPRLACLTLGDAGAAVLIDAAPDERSGFRALELYTIGKHSPLCIAQATDQPHGGSIMVTDMMQLANVAVSAFLQHSAWILFRLGWRAEQVDHVLPHQTSRTTLDTGSREVKRLVGNRGMPVDNEKLINNVADRGNTATTSHFIALADSFASRRIKPGDTVVFGVLASGVTVGTAVYRFDDLPRRHVNGDGLKNQPPVPIGSRQGGTFGRPEGLPRVRIEAVGLFDPDRSVPSDTLSMLADAAKACLSRSAYGPSDVDHLFSTGVYRTGFLSEPAIAALVAGLVKVNEDPVTPRERKSLAFDILSGGLGFLKACYLASVLIGSQAARRILVTASEVENNARTVPDHLRGVKVMASAAMLDSDPEGKAGFGAFRFKCFPEHEDALTVYATTRQLRIEGRSLARVHVAKAKDLEQRFILCVMDAVSEFLSEEGIRPEDIAVVLPPQISPGFVPALAGALGMDLARFVDLCHPDGDLFTSTLPATFAGVAGRVKPGDLGLIINVASGIEVACATYHF